MEDKARSESSVQIWDCHGCWTKEPGYCLVGIWEPPVVFESKVLLVMIYNAAVSNSDLKKSGSSHSIRKPLYFLL